MQDNKKQVAVLGATGVIGQVFVWMLANHPWFNLSVLTGSDSRAGKYFCDEVQWLLPEPLPKSLQGHKLETLDIKSLKEKNIKIVFSALPGDIANRVERELKANGFYVFSNASAMRYDENVPILIPEVNKDALKLIEKQGFPKEGFVVTNANCSTTGLATALAPLKVLGIKEVLVSTYQSISGAGYPGLSALDIMGNAIPFIDKEEEKMKVELKKILEMDLDIYPTCVRIPVLFGHLETVWVTFEKKVETGDVLDAWENYTLGSKEELFPSLPLSPVLYMDDDGFPQPKQSFLGKPAGMQVFTGRLRKEANRIGFVLLVNNLVKGGAGGSVANAELFLSVYGHLV